jgi:hypothetical protein
MGAMYIVAGLLFLALGALLLMRSSRLDQAGGRHRMTGSRSG